MREFLFFLKFPKIKIKTTTSHSSLCHLSPLLPLPHDASVRATAGRHPAGGGGPARCFQHLLSLGLGLGPRTRPASKPPALAATRLQPRPRMSPSVRVLDFRVSNVHGVQC